MARPAKFDRSEAVGAAMKEIWRDGYEAASVKHLSEVLGISRSSFYNAFGSREDLFREAVAAYLAIVPSLPLLGPAREPVLPRLTDFVRANCRFIAQNDWSGCLVANCLAEICPADQGPGAEISRLALESARRLEALLDRAKVQGEIPQGADTHALALAVQTLLIGLSVFGKALRSEQELWRTAEVTLRGLGLYAEVADASVRLPSQG
jgi:TetR/AcrR family transcriptional regulator, transcriptional repressor for nem operon